MTYYDDGFDYSASAWTANVRQGLDFDGNRYGNTLYGDFGGDLLSGGGGDDHLIGVGGNDRLNGGAGRDHMDGGPGNDVFVVSETDDHVIEHSDEGRDRIESGISFALPRNVEDLTLIGRRAIDARGNAGDNVLIGNDSPNRLVGGRGSDRMIGGAGDDRYVMDDLGDEVVEKRGGGVDLIDLRNYSEWEYALPRNVENLIAGSSAYAPVLVRGNRLENVIKAGDWTGILYGAGGDDALTGGYNLYGGAGDDRLECGLGDAELYGDSGNDRLIGTDYTEILDGGRGIDRMIGRGGQDSYYVDDIGDMIVEVADGGDDRVNTTVSYVIPKHVEMLFLAGEDDTDGTGSNRGEMIVGNDGANVLRGLGGDDQLIGADGEDRLVGGRGHDELAGGGRADIFVFERVGDFIPGERRDLIEDFQPDEDLIDLTTIDASITEIGDQAFTFIGESAFSGTPGQLRYAGGVVAGDTNGDGGADLEISLSIFGTWPDLTDGDFLL